MIKYTRTNLKKIEDIFQDLSFRIRYEKGNFQSGYCIVDEKDIIVINRFYDVEGRINCLLEIIDTIDIDQEQLSETNLKTLALVRSTIESTKEETTQAKEETSQATD